MTPLDRPLAALFAGLSRVRRKRIFHPHGVGFAASLVPLGSRPTGVRAFDSGEPLPAIVRLSRSAGLPEALPDPCGLGVRLTDAYGPDRHQDFLLVSSGAAVGARHLILPARGFADRLYSSLLPYRAGGGLRLVGATALAARPGPLLADLRERESGELTIRVMLATLGGAWEPVAQLELAERLPDRDVEPLRLNPSNTGGGLELAGALNRLRPPAYAGSQAGRRASGEPRPAPSTPPGVPSRR